MLTLGHAGAPLAPHDLWGAWQPDVAVVLALAVALWMHQRGGRQGARRRDGPRSRAFLAATATVAVALLSPLAAAAGSLASAHMLQHVLLVAVAAPLFAASAPGSRLLRAVPPAMRRLPGRVRRRLGMPAGAVRQLSHPVTVWLLHVGTVWVWHSRAAYEATLEHPPVHAAEHALFLGTAVLFWRVAIGARGTRVEGGIGVLLLFGAAMANVLLAVLLTFASEPWYGGYAATTTGWGLGQLADQQLAGVLLWVPAGGVYVVVALRRFAGWLDESADAAPSLR